MAIRAKKLQPAKVEAIANVKTVLEGYNDYIFADYRGLTVEQITELRKQLRAKDCQFKVMKNNFVKVAFDEMKIENLADYLAGPTAIALLKDDPNEVAKILFDFAKEAPALQVKGAFIDKEIYDAEKIEAFSKLPGKKQLIAMLMSAINGPAQKLAATLQAYVEKLEKEGPAPAAPAAEAPKAEEAAPAAEAPAEA
jgi:large subunit ribosomal protein L10